MEIRLAGIYELVRGEEETKVSEKFPIREIGKAGPILDKIQIIRLK